MIEAVLKEWQEGRSKTIIHAATGTGKCVDPMTWVWSNGLKRFKDIFGQEDTIAGPNGPAQIAGWHDDGVNPGVLATLNCGITINGTLAHRVWAKSKDQPEGWVYMSDLTIGHSVAIARGQAHFGTNDFKRIDARNLGIAVGKGHQIDEELGKKFGIRKGYRFTSNSCELPQSILLANRRSIFNFLDGLLSTGPATTPQQFHAYFKDLAKQIQMLLIGLGVSCDLGEDFGGTSVYINDERGWLDVAEGKQIQELSWSQVKSLESSDIHRIDCEVAEQHAFIGNGIINHNTVTAAKLVDKIRDNGKCLFIADMRRLVEQTEDKFHRWGIATAVEMGDRRAKDSMALMGGYDCVIATRQTLGSPKRLSLWRPDEFVYGIIDECQSAQGSTIKMLMSYFSGIKYWVGLSATPYRADGKPLVPDIFESIAYHYPLKDYPDGRPGAISNGHLVPVRMVECNVGIDLRGLKKTITKYGKDYSQQELEDRISGSVDKMANGARMEMKRLGVRKAIHFTPDVKTAYAFESAYSAMGLRARAVHGENPDRDGITRQFDEDELDVIISCQLLNVGVDFPSCDCAIMGRPTKSHGLAMQQIGRITRISPETGKTVGWVIGFAWECDDEGPVSTLDLFFEDEPDPRLCQIGREIARGMKGQDFDPLTILEMAKKQREREKEDEERRERAREAREKKKADTVMRLQIAARERAVSYRRRELDPLGVALASPIQQPVHNYSHNEVSENIKNVLKSYGIHDTRSLTPDQALKAVEFWADRDFRKRSSYSQVKFLMGQGWSEERALSLSREEARHATNDRFAKFREFKSK
jgi:superfamily II DNA or RNA helicase